MPLIVEVEELKVDCFDCPGIPTAIPTALQETEPLPDHHNTVDKPAVDNSALVAVTSRECVQMRSRVQLHIQALLV